MSSNLRFRNIDATPDTPVETWPFEGILTALERGSLPDWARLTHAIDADPWGHVARQVEEALNMELPYGVAELFQEIVTSARASAGNSERYAVAQEIRTLLDQSGLSRSTFAERIGTSSSRLSTYLSGKVVPSAALMVRMRRVATTSRQKFARRTAAPTS
jgi:DNA-binding transcriptional regulator YiaG